ncbi:MAG: PIN domain-containing protein [Polyangia bacterium]
MKRGVFVDTSFFVAALDVRDSAHRRALELAGELNADGSPMVTSDAVMLELGNYFSRSPLRMHAIEWIKAVRRADGWEVVPLTRSLIYRGENRYHSYTDKSWSMVDCIGMEVMLDRGIREVATTDEHFTQAGFRLLMEI